MIAGLHDLGLLCALGTGPDAVRAAMVRGSVDGMHRVPDAAPGRDLVIGGVADPLPALPPCLHHLDSRNNRLALAALTQLRRTLDPLLARTPAHRVGVAIGTSTSGIAEGGDAVRAWLADGAVPDGFDYRQQEPASTGEFVATVLGAAGPVVTVSTACTSSARAMITARRWLALGLCDVVIAGGVDTLCDLTVRGFLSIDAVSRGPCRPFCADRDGINLGEAAALFVMTREPASVNLLGAGSSSDAYHMSSPDPEAVGAITAMRAALTDAGRTPADIAYVNLHGTATRHNDAMEARAVSEVFPGGVSCSSTKPMTGHTLGAAGALEAALCWLTLTDPARRLPPQVASLPLDPGLPPLVFAQDGAVAGPGPVALMSNSFAFGGNNTSLVLGAGP